MALNPVNPIEGVIKQYRALDRDLLPHARFFMSEDTAKAVARRYGTYIDGPMPSSTMMGIPVLIDDSMPLNAVRLDAETPFDRMIREARTSGATVNVMKPIYTVSIPSPPLPAPDPTLRALLRCWAKKLRNQ